MLESTCSYKTIFVFVFSFDLFNNFNLTMLIYLVIILLGLARHEEKYQGYLFHAVSRADEGVDGKHLLPWVVDDLKGTIHIPCLCLGKELQLSVGVKYQKSVVINDHVFLEEVWGFLI